MSDNIIDPVELALRARQQVGPNTKVSAATDPATDEAVRRAKLSQAAAEAVKYAESQVAQRVQEQEDALAGLHGAVTVHAQSHALCRFKTSMARGKCWLCGVNDPDPTSVYHRCTSCDDARLKSSFPIR